MELNERYNGKLYFLLNIEVGMLIKGKPDDIRRLVLKNLDTVARDGFYTCGSSNYIISKMPAVSMDTMIVTVT